MDGTKINLPRPLIEEGYRTPSRLVHYPQGLVSCLYQLRSKIPVDFDLHAHENEREAALAHLKALSENDVVVYDRGYYSWEMLHAHAVRGLHPVFRIKRSSAFDAFIAGRETEAIIDVAPGKKVLRRLRLKHGCDAAAPCRLRLVKYTAGETVFVLGTTLLDRKTYPAQDLRDLYLGRWGDRGVVQNLQATDDGPGLPRPKRARGQTGTLCPLHPDHPDAAVLKPGRRPHQGQPARRHEASNAGQLQEQPDDGREKHRRPASPAGGHAQRNGHAHRRNHRRMPAAGAPEQVVPPALQKAARQVAPRQGHRDRGSWITRRKSENRRGGDRFLK